MAAPDNGIPDALFEEVYSDLRRLASARLARERPGHTLQATALVHEAWLRLAGQDRVRYQGRTHFLGVAAISMRRLLVDHARGRQRDKRGGDWARVTLGDAADAAADALRLVDVLTLDTAIERLAALDPRQARIVELRYFGGLTVPEVAEALGVSTRTVEQEWSHARAWLRRDLTRAAQS